MATDADMAPVSDLAIPPGELLEEELAEINLTIDEFAARIGYTTELVRSIIRGDGKMTPEFADKIESVLGSPAYLWLRLDERYQEDKARLGVNEMRKD